MFQNYHALKSIKKSAKGPDKIPFWFFKNNAVFLEVFTHVFDRSLRTGLFPDRWKISKFIPLAKVSRPKEQKELRPVSIRDIVARCCERIVINMFVKPSYVSSVSNQQFGFRPQGSTSRACIKILNDISFYRQTPDYVRLFTLDMSKAFDTISHESIWRGPTKLKPTVNASIVNRCNYTCFFECTSQVMQTNQGAPPGTIGAPTYYGFSVHYISVNDLDGKLTVFTDDNTPIIPG